jgi:hypothetical protein
MTPRTPRSRIFANGACALSFHALRRFVAPSLRRCVLLTLITLALPACGGVKNFENDNDRLRAENMDLSEKVATLTRENESLRAALAAAQSESKATKDPLPTGVTKPVLARVEFARFSGGIDTNKDNLDDALRLYILTLDQRDRFVQVIGDAKITVVATRPNADALTVATMSLDAKQLADVYRASFAGTHYTVIVPITTEPPPGTKQLLVHLTLHDRTTGHDHTCQQLLNWAGK